MKTKIIRIGNSHGVRIPKPLLDQLGMVGEVQISASKNALVLRPIKQPRQGWAEAFRKMAERGDDALLDAERSGTTRWDEIEWVW